MCTFVIQDATRGVRSAAQDMKNTAAETVKVYTRLPFPADIYNIITLPVVLSYFP